MRSSESCFGGKVDKDEIDFEARSSRDGACRLAAFNNYVYRLQHRIIFYHCSEV